MQELRLFVPTFDGRMFWTHSKRGRTLKFGVPKVPVLVHEASGVRIVLGSHDGRNVMLPNVQIERQPNGWVVFLHPLCGCDACGYVYFHDDGRCFLQKQRPLGPTPELVILGFDDDVPGFYLSDGPSNGRDV